MDKRNLIPKEYPDKKVIGTRHFFQFDSVTVHGPRMCNTSALTTLAWTLRPELVGDDPNADDEYLEELHARFGDTTDHQAQARYLKKEMRIDARFRTDLWLKDAAAHIMKGYPLVCGTVHKGPYDRPHGGGHMMALLGWDFTEGRDDLIFHDPAGKMRLLHGGYGPGSGRYVRYSRRYWLPRWQVNGTLGWGMWVDGLL